MKIYIRNFLVGIQKYILENHMIYLFSGKYDLNDFDE